jgi:tetratricopeptide (TPR) repeat protein
VLARRHAIYFRDLAQAAEPEFTGPDPRATVIRLSPDRDNFRAAMAWAIEADEAPIGLGLGSAIWRYWQGRGELREGRDWLDRLLALPTAAAATAIRARGLTAAGGIAYWQGDGAMHDHYEQALAIYRGLNDIKGTADSLQNLAFATLTSRKGPEDTDRALEFFRDSLALYRDLEDEANIASVVGALGFGELTAGRYDAARPAIEESLRLNLVQGLRGRAIDNSWALGHLERFTGHMAAAAAQYRAALVGARELADATRLLMQLGSVSSYAMAIGRGEDAVRLAGAVERARLEQGGMIGTSSIPGLGNPVDEARSTGVLSEAEINESLSAGGRMGLDEAVDFALSLLDAEAQEDGRGRPEGR